MESMEAQIQKAYDEVLAFDVIDFARWRRSGRLTERLNSLVKPDAWRSQAAGFVIMGTKK
jgi:hypothetical protein